MEINETCKLVENSLKSNSQISQSHRDKIVACVKDFSIFFDDYDIEIDVDSLCELLPSLSIENSYNIDTPYQYRADLNKIFELRDMEKISKISKEELDISFAKIVLSLLTNVYNIETDKRNEGLMFEVNGKEYGKILNEKMKDRIIELIYGNPDDSYVEVETLEDNIATDFQEIIDLDTLLTCFINGRGDIFYSQLSNLYGEEEVNKLFSTLKKYEKIDINDKKARSDIKDGEYKKKIEEIKSKKKEEQKSVTM